MADKIRYGIIGFGKFADRTIAPAIRQSQHSELVAVHNRAMAKARSLAATHASRHAFDSVRALVDCPDVEAVFITSPNSLHCEETILAAEAGKHVLVEKPMAMNIAECERMVEACDKHNVKLMVGHMVRLSPLVERVRQLVHSGGIGRVIRAEANFTYDGRGSERVWLKERKVAGGGPVFDIGVHCLDTLRYILDDEVVSVKGELRPKPTTEQTETTAWLLLTFSRGTPAGIFCSYDSPVRESSLEILGTEARVSAINFTVGGRRSALEVEKKGPGIALEVVTEEINVPNLYIDEIDGFSDAILTGTGPRLTAQSAIANQRVLDQAMKL